MASLQKRGNTWSYRVEGGIDPNTNKRKQITKGGFKTKKEAQLAANKLEESLANGSWFQESDITFEKFADTWIKYYATQVKISSVRARRIALKKLVAEWGHLPLKKITRFMYQDHINSLSHSFSRNYIDSIHTTGNMLFKHAVRTDLILRNPTDGFVLPKKQLTVEEIENEKKHEQFLELEELSIFLKETKKRGMDMDYITFAALAYTGLRIGELLALKWKDIDLNKNTLRVSKTYHNPNNNMTGYTLLTPKTKKSARTISFDKNLTKLFKKHRFEQNELKMEQRLVYQDEDFIFAENSGHPRNMKQVINRLNRILKGMNLNKHITPHSFRHTHTSLLIEAGAGIKEIQERLGHSEIETTMNIYAHMTKNVEEKTSLEFSKLTEGIL